MALDFLRLIYKHLSTILHFLASEYKHSLLSIPHRLTYKRGSSPLSVVVIGGSFAGVHLVKRLSHSLPSGYRVILIERNTHFNYTFNFPRYSVVQGREQKAFLPFTGLVTGAPKGILEIVRDEVVGIEGNEVLLGSGERVRYEYLAIATGTSSYLPAKVRSTLKEEGRAELRGLQEKIKDAQSVAIVGGGAVGVQVATDIRSYYPEKKVVLVHSREQLLPSFGKRLHDHVVQVLERMNIEVVLSHRPILPEKYTDGIDIMQKEGGTSHFELVIPCTGQTPNSSFLTTFSPASISTTTSHILVSATLQLLSSSSQPTSQSPETPIFALGDVAHTLGPKMARAGHAQAVIVSSNIMSLIHNHNNHPTKPTSQTKESNLKLKEYVPVPLEGILNVSLGREKSVMYVQDNTEEFLFENRGGEEDLAVGKVRVFLGFGKGETEGKL